MVEYTDEQQLSELFKAVSDGTRRALITQLCQQGPTRVTELATCYDMSLNAISKHIKVLEKTELVVRKTLGRSHWIEVNLYQLSRIEGWFAQMKSIWELRLDMLDKVLTGDTENE
jgi:DNA-binding transcriptional ArsR family regulator